MDITKIVVHIIGETVKKKIKHKNSSNYIPINFTNEMAALLQNCDLVISRSGAGTINELMVMKKPSILIPYPGSKNNHQEKNALILSSLGGAILINQHVKSNSVLADTLKRIFRSSVNNKYEMLDLMTKNMNRINLNNSKYEIAKIINQFSRN